MTEEKYKLNILKDILLFDRRILSDNEKTLLLSSALYQSKNYFTSAALLVKNGWINMDDILALTKLRKEELNDYLSPVEDSYDYFALVTPEEILNAYKEVEEFTLNYPEEGKINQKKKEEMVAKIKELSNEKNIKRGA